jgi:hypothetical protein
MFQRLTTNIQDGSRLGKVKAGSNPEAEYEETLAKAAGFLAALNEPRMDGGKPRDGHALCADGHDL